MVSFVDAVPKTRDFIDIARIPPLTMYFSPTMQITKDARIVVNYPLSNEVFSFDGSEEGFERHSAKSKEMTNEATVKTSQ